MLVVFVVAMAAPGLFFVARKIRPPLGRRTGRGLVEQREAWRRRQQTLRWNRRRAEGRGELPPW